MHWGRAGCAALLIASSAVVACGGGDDAASAVMSPAAAGAVDAAVSMGPTTAGATGSTAAPASGSTATRSGATKPTGGSSAPVAGTAGPAANGGAGTGTGMSGPPAMSPGSCCSGGDCVCHGEPPRELSGAAGPYAVMQYAVQGVGCVYYPPDAAPPLAAVAIAEGLGGSGGCDSVQTGEWGPLYASHGIVAMIVETGSGTQQNARGEALGAGIAAFKAEHERSDSPLFGKLAGRYGTSGFALGGGATTYAAEADSSLRSSVAIMPWGPADRGSMVPTLVLCGSSDGIAPCSAHGNRAYSTIDASVPKMRVALSGGHNGQPTAGDGSSGAYVLAFQKLFLEGDERWRPLLVAAKSEETTIR